MAEEGLREDFYVDLMSNSSLKYYRDNNLSTFKVWMPKPINLEGDYEVALTQIIFPSSIVEPLKGKLYITAPATTDEEFLDTINPHLVPLYSTVYVDRIPNLQRDEKIPPNVRTIPNDIREKYRTTVLDINLETDEKRPPLTSDDFLPYLNKMLFENSDRKVLQKRYLKENPILARNTEDDESSTKVDWKLPINFRFSNEGDLEIILRDEDTELLLDTGFARILGINLNEKEYLRMYESGIYKFHNSRPKSASTRPAFFNVYSDIITPLIFSDVMAPNLRTIAIPSESSVDKSVSTNFTLLDYHKVSLRNFQSIEINLRDGAGNPVPFDYGLVYLRLHFRPRGNKKL